MEYEDCLDLTDFLVRNNIIKAYMGQISVTDYRFLKGKEIKKVSREEYAEAIFESRDLQISLREMLFYNHLYWEPDQSIMCL